MTAEEYNKSVKELMTIPGVARSIAEDLIQLGIKRVSDLKDKDPERLYSRSNRQDKNVLYMFRCAVYFASNETHDTEKLKWSNWK